MADDVAGAVRRTPRPARGDHAEIIVPVVQAGAGATNPGGLVSPDVGNGTGDLRAKLIEDLRGALVREPEEVGETGVDQWYVDEFAVDCSTEPLLRVLARGLLAAGWRPPLPDDDTLRAELRAVTAQRNDAQRAGRKFVGQLNEIRALLPIKHIDDLNRIATIVGWPKPSGSGAEVQP